MSLGCVTGFAATTGAGEVVVGAASCA